MTTRIQTFGGNIGIGTDDPGSFKLNVNGDVKADSLIINGVTNSQVPIGLIQIWYGSVETIPTGWVLCNGATGITRSDGGGTINAPDLRDRFVRGVTSTPQVGQTAGANTVTLSEANLAGHAHTFTSGSSNAPHDHGIDSSNHYHDHGLGNGGGQHPHPMTQVAAPHTHPTQGVQCDHSHANQGANAPHTHTSGAANALHSHQFLQGYPNPAGGGNRRAWVINNQALATGTSNAPHGHTTNSSNAPHKHNYNANNMPHGHQSGPDNATHTHTVNGNSTPGHAHTIANANATHGHTIPADAGTHSHTGTTNATGQATPVAIQNPYYLLAYIMKI